MPKVNQSSRLIQKPSLRDAWLRQHRGSAADAWHSLAANRGAAILSILVIGVTLSLPLGLSVAERNVAALKVRLGALPQATLFLHDDLILAEAEGLVRKLQADERLQGVRLIHRDDALIDFAQAAQLQQIIIALPSNPLPHVIVASVSGHELDATAGHQLQQDLNASAGVAEVQFDLEWLQRLGALSALAVRATWILAIILGIGVMLITGNTIRVGIHQRQEEIEVAKLCGATDAFVRRPFLYSGALQGLFGGSVALLIVTLSLSALREPLQTLIQAHGGTPQAIEIASLIGTATVGIGAFLGWFGAWVAVSVYLRRMDISRTE